jgi:ABC-type sugar transport system substrate-binding protein
LAGLFGGSTATSRLQSASFQKAAEADGVEVALVNAKDDVTVQAKAMDDWIASGIDGLVLQPADPAAVAEPTKAARAANIPLVYVGTVPNADTGAPKAPFVPFQDMKDLTFKEGAEAAKWVVDTLHQTPKLVIFDWVEIPVSRRADGAVRRRREASRPMPRSSSGTRYPEQDQTLAKMEDQLQKGPRFQHLHGLRRDLILGGSPGCRPPARAGR